MGTEGGRTLIIILFLCAAASTLAFAIQPFSPGYKDHLDDLLSTDRLEKEHEQSVNIQTHITTSKLSREILHAKYYSLRCISAYADSMDT